jgi:hypothetical protein
MTDQEESGDQGPHARKTNVSTAFVPTSRFDRWTFEDANIRRWVEGWLSGRVLNACAGKTWLNHDDEVVTNDLDAGIDTDLSVDVAELSKHFEAESFDTIVYDPPWSNYQSNLRYEGRRVHKEVSGRKIEIDLDELPIDIPNGREKEQLGHARLAKEGFDYLLAPGGRVVEITFHGTCMPRRMGYRRLERVIFDPVGEGKAVIGSVDRKMQRKLPTSNEVKKRA